MNEIVCKTEAKASRANASVSVELILALREPVVRREWYPVSYRLADCLSDTAERRLREALAGGEAVLAEQRFQWLVEGLKPACVPASPADIRRELGVLLLAFPTKDDLSAFVEIAAVEIAGERPSRLRLAAACRELRRTARFRPSIAEILEAMAAVSLDYVGGLLKMPGLVHAVRERLCALAAPSTTPEAEA